MKIKTILLVICAAFSLVSIAQAQDATVEANVSTEASVQTTEGQKKPLPVRAGIKATIENRLEKNRDVRNPLVEKKMEMREEAKAEMKEVRTEKRAEVKEIRAEAKTEMKLMRASSTDMFKKSVKVRKDMREEIKKKMKLNEFNARKNALVKELTVAISNLTNISTRIEARITKVEAEGHIMTDSKALLATANEKLTIAKTEVSAFQALSIDSATTTAEVDLEKPRVLGDSAIKSVKEAKEAFQKVIVSIAHSMGAEVKVN